ncbi:hypothetical protein FCM35_KLT15393 [Carex littledalei]|uniref:Uncharacterized protein n=1 Tax=Carex littledalei TaxID=544730 RepID=A0A833RHI5_9POAL|nr:hypothetical protein FCM35_KLT15393 [Carex littledalei]
MFGLHGLHASKPDLISDKPPPVVTSGDRRPPTDSTANSPNHNGLLQGLELVGEEGFAWSGRNLNRSRRYLGLDIPSLFCCIEDTLEYKKEKVRRD